MSITGRVLSRISVSVWRGSRRLATDRAEYWSKFGPSVPVMNTGTDCAPTAKSALVQCTGYGCGGENGYTGSGPPTAEGRDWEPAGADGGVGRTNGGGGE